ncbi:MAG: hypothetical protein J6A05_10110 [Oscillospiraceae bacterium]|nr:hypothetical protein [Oscillospiraceae bacterium]
MNVMTKVNEVRDCVIKKAVPLSVSAVAAANALMISAFAEGETTGTGVDISAITDSMTSSLTDLVGKVALACAGVVGVGLTIFGIKWVVRTIKSFFTKIAG